MVSQNFVDDVSFISAWYFYPLLMAVVPWAIGVSFEQVYKEWANKN